MDGSKQKKLDGFFNIGTRKRPLETSNVDQVSTPPAKRRTTGFDPRWTAKYPWLEQVDGGILCTLCIKHNKHSKAKQNGKSIWTETPCVSLREDSIMRHKQSDVHLDALRCESILQLGGGLRQAFQCELTATQTAISAAMKCIYWICKEELPLYDTYRSLLNLCQGHLGAGELKNLPSKENAKYTSNRFVEEVVSTIGTAIESDNTKEAKASPFYSIMLDETTDVDVKKELVVYIRYLKDGVSVTHFDAMLELKDGKAETITSAVLDHIQRRQLPIKNLCALGSDGAAVMLGHRAGVSALLKEKVPHLLVNHCVAHRLALASSQSANQIPYLKKFKDIVEQLYRFYHNSPVRSSALKDIQAVLNDPVVKVTQAKDVRWLSHDKAVQSIRICLSSIITSLEREAQERNDSQAMGLSVFIQTYNFVATLHMMSDILPVLSRLSKAMQKKDLDYSVISPLISGTKATISSLKEQPSEHFSSLQEKMTELVASPFRFRMPSEKEITDYKKNIYCRFLDNIIDNLNKRFPHIPLLEAFSIFRFRDATEHDLENAEYGKNELEMLCNHYDFDMETGESEWRTVVHMARTDSQFKDQLAESVMCRISKMVEAFPVLSKICSAGLLIPTSTADCERGFSALKRVKTEHRNRLQGKVLNSLLMITLEGPQLDKLDINPIFQEWDKEKDRRYKK